MKTLSSKKSSLRRRKIIIFTVIIALIGVGAGAYYVVKSNQDAQEKQKALDRDRKASKTNGSAKKDEMAKDKTSNSSGSGLPENSTSTTSDQVPTNPALSVSITSTSQANGMVNASAKTSGDGTCVFLYTKEGDKPASRQVPASSGSCSSSIPAVEVPYGSVKLTVTYYNGGKKAEATQNVTIN